MWNEFYKQSTAFSFQQKQQQLTLSSISQMKNDALSFVKSPFKRIGLPFA